MCQSLFDKLFACVDQLNFSTQILGSKAKGQNYLLHPDIDERDQDEDDAWGKQKQNATTT